MGHRHSWSMEEHAPHAGQGTLWLADCILEGIVKERAPGWETKPRRVIECQAEKLELGPPSPGKPLLAVALVICVRSIS